MSAGRGIPVIGLVGGIGSGKSAVARAFEALGCAVSDSDAQARAVLALPDVIEELRSWWGDRVIAADGSVDRKAVATIVFADPAQRVRLERLTHPRIHEARRAQLAQAESAGAPALIVDAPLLLEAGLEAECDAIVFVDTPREIRLERVQKNRGWDAQELDRREKAQLSLEEKRKRSDHVVSNGGPIDEINAQVARVLSAVRQDFQAAS